MDSSSYEVRERIIQVVDVGETINSFMCLSSIYSTPTSTELDWCKISIKGFHPISAFSRRFLNRPDGSLQVTAIGHFSLLNSFSQ